VIADAGYWHTRQIEAIRERGIEVLLPPDGNTPEGKRPGWENGLYELMRRKLSTENGRKLYAQRKITIEPVHGQIKHNRHIDRFMRTGRAAAQSEWRLVTATHNRGNSTATGPPAPPNTGTGGHGPGGSAEPGQSPDSPSFRIFRQPRNKAIAHSVPDPRCGGRSQSPEAVAQPTSWSTFCRFATR
jgi:hypothetical protein